MVKGPPTRNQENRTRHSISLPRDVPSRDEAKRIPPDDLCACLVHLGSRPYLLLNFTLGSAERPLGLTPAERQVALALLQGLSNGEIADLRGSSPRTVANQIAGLYRKLGVRSRAELALRWAHALSPTME